MNIKNPHLDKPVVREDTFILDDDNTIKVVKSCSVCKSMTLVPCTQKAADGSCRTILCSKCHKKNLQP
jgi:hypothetical protein